MADKEFVLLRPKNEIIPFSSEEVDKLCIKIAAYFKPETSQTEIEKDIQHIKNIISRTNQIYAQLTNHSFAERVTDINQYDLLVRSLILFYTVLRKCINDANELSSFFNAAFGNVALYDSGFMKHYSELLNHFTTTFMSVYLIEAGLDSKIQQLSEFDVVKEKAITQILGAQQERLNIINADFVAKENNLDSRYNNYKNQLDKLYNDNNQIVTDALDKIQANSITKSTISAIRSSQIVMAICIFIVLFSSFSLYEHICSNASISFGIIDYAVRKYSQENLVYLTVAKYTLSSLAISLFWVATIVLSVKLFRSHLNIYNGYKHKEFLLSNIASLIGKKIFNENEKSLIIDRIMSEVTAFDSSKVAPNAKGFDMESLEKIVNVVKPKSLTN